LHTERHHSGNAPRRGLQGLVLLALISTGMPALPGDAQAQQLRLGNPLGVDRMQEVVEIPLQQVTERLRLPAEKLADLVALDSATQQRIPSQLYSHEGDAAPDTLLLLVQLPPHGTLNVSFHLDPAAASQRPLVFGREAPERKDDFAWENEVVAYRVYGPALQATGEIASGIDVWSKRVPNFVIDAFYKRDAEGQRTHNHALSYHKDNGQGLDSYEVGHTRGCGGTGVWADGRLYVSKNYTTKKVLGNGPIRFAFEVSYAPWDADGRTVTETKRITLDAGTHLNKIESTYTFQGATPLELAAGIAIHKGAESRIPAAGRILSVWDTPQDPSAGRISTGLVALPNQHAETLLAADHALMIFTRRSGVPFSYFAGAGWSKADMPTADAWNAYLASFLNQHEHPITVHWVMR
jgi:hypothetical protein